MKWQKKSLFSPHLLILENMFLMKFQRWEVQGFPNLAMYQKDLQSLTELQLAPTHLRPPGSESPGRGREVGTVVGATGESDAGQCVLSPAPQPSSCPAGEASQPPGTDHRILHSHAYAKFKTVSYSFKKKIKSGMASPVKTTCQAPALPFPNTLPTNTRAHLVPVLPRNLSRGAAVK